MEKVILNGQLIAKAHASIPLNDRGFRYGDGLFETIRVAHGRPYQWDFHQNRLDTGLAAIRIAFDTHALTSLCEKLIAANQLSDGLLRIQITRGVGGRGYLPDAENTPTVLIETAPLPVGPQKAVALWLSAYEKISPKALPVQHKIAQGLNSTLARMEAADNHCADALLLNAKGELCETASSNIFWLKNGEWFTPSLICGALNGSTRAALLRLIRTQEIVAPLAKLEQADAVIICNAALGVIPIAALLPQNWQWNSEPSANQLNELLHADRKATL